MTVSGELPARYSKEQLHRIMEEAFVYMCACPGQVAQQTLALRNLYDYQRKCVNEGSLMEQVHTRIAAAATQAHEIVERCLGEVLEMEGWDKTTLSMPEGLRQLRADTIKNNRDL
jgi:hypothetical protein